MSLKIFVHAKTKRVVIVPWFRDPKFRIDYSSGPFLEMYDQEFRERGSSLIKRHFEAYDRIRVSEQQVVQPFEPGQAKKMLKDAAEVFVWKNDAGNVYLAPVRPRKSDPLVFEDLGRENHRCLPENFTAADFWKVFDEVLAVAE